ncbi:MAG: hypothetical protein DRI36_00445 [Caldiserica bacterium]|nr:MAG: hypothetical protein DRI36_00445 [Caldisericota bacterium]
MPFGMGPYGWFWLWQNYPYFSPFGYLTPEAELNFLKQQKEFLEAQLKAIEERIQELESSNK